MGAGEELASHENTPVAASVPPAAAATIIRNVRKIVMAPGCLVYEITC